MAEMLKRQYDIVVLKVQLLDSRPNVLFTLQAKVDGTLTNLESWKSDTSDMGFTERTSRGQASYRDITGNLPSAMVSYIRNWLTYAVVENTPLWVHLVKPYGVLRFVPWERALGTELSGPVLMLPDFIFPPPRESSAMLDVVLCGSAPLNSEHAWVLQALRDVAESIITASARRTRLHIFTDSDFIAPLRADFAKNPTVFIHKALDAAPYVEQDLTSRLVDKTGQLRSPWLLWMRDALKGQSVDVVHFCCHGWLTKERGALLFAQSPIERTDRYLAGPVGQTELGTFLTQVGAWSAAFTSVYDDNSEPGLRALADEIAQARPGPLLMSNTREDPKSIGVADAYRFLYSVEPAEPPKSTSLFMYCQPYRVKQQGKVKSATARAIDFKAIANVSPLGEIFDREENVLPWIASTERFAEQMEVRYQPNQSPIVDSSETSAPAARNIRHDIALETVNQLRDAVARLAASEPRGGGSSGGVL